MNRCLIYLEAGYEKYSVDLLTAAEAMYGNECETFALAVESDHTAAMGHFDEVIAVEGVPSYDTARIAEILEELQKNHEFHSILIPATYMGRMLAPRAAMRLRTGLVADVTEIGHRDGRLMMVRPAFSGKIMAGIVNERTTPMMMSVRPGVFTWTGGPGKETQIHHLQETARTESGIRLMNRVTKPESKDIRESRVLVSAGGGAMNAMETVERLAGLLHGMKAASRRTVDSGRADRSIQVGQSGKVVHPDLYIAAGIFGAIQHIAGLSKVKHLIAINTDPKAPICSLADIVVVADAGDFMEKLIRRIEEEHK